MMVAAAMTAGGCLAITLAGYPLAAMILAVAAAVCATLAIFTVRQMDDGSRTRGSLRVELVAAVGAWIEMALLGAADQLMQRTLQRLATFEDHRFQQAVRTAHTLGAARAVSAAALLVTVALGVDSGAAVSTLVFLALLAADMMISAERLLAAAEAWTLANQADGRLASAQSDDIRRPRCVPVVRATYDRSGLTVSGDWLPDTPTRNARQIEFAVTAGCTLIVTGESGSGKTTLLDAIANALRQAAIQPTPRVVTAVLADDYLFAGIVSTNVRLPDPTASDDDIRDLLNSTLLDQSGLDPSTMIGVWRAQPLRRRTAPPAPRPAVVTQVAAAAIKLMAARSRR